MPRAEKTMAAWSQTTLELIQKAAQTRADQKQKQKVLQILRGRRKRMLEQMRTGQRLTMMVQGRRRMRLIHLQPCMPP